jgi:uncharacterized BrkB/YihY/UPF0761 family membrane protein
MSASEGKVLGIIILIFLIFILAFPVRLLFFAPSASLSGIFHHWPRPFDHISFDHWDVVGIAGLSLIGFALLALWIVVLVWVYRDAEKRGMSGVLWALIVFIGHLVGLLIYLIVRSSHPLVTSDIHDSTPNCPKCGKIVGANHMFCPYCGERMKENCPKCAKPLGKGWSVCPHCGEKL